MKWFVIMFYPMWFSFNLITISDISPSDYALVIGFPRIFEDEKSWNIHMNVYSLKHYSYKLRALCLEEANEPWRSCVDLRFRTDSEGVWLSTRDPRPATRDPRPATISQSRHSEQFTESIVEIFTRLNMYSNRAGVIYFWAPREVFKKKKIKIQFQSPECEVLSVC